MENNILELHYFIQPFPEQNKYLFRIYDAEDIENLYFINKRQHRLEIEDDQVYLIIGLHHFLLKNVDKNLINQFIERKVKWGFSFLDNYHAVLSGFYAI